MTRSIRTTVARPAKAAFAAFCDAARLPEWVPEIRRAVPVRLGAEGLPAEVRFQSVTPRGDVAEYSLLYVYDAARLRVAWMPGEHAGDAVRGFASFTDLGAGCELAYALELGPARGAEEAEMLAQAERVVAAFKAWVEAR